VVRWTVAPTVSVVNPVGGTTGVEPTATVSATFDEDMLAISIDGGSFTLSDSNGAKTGGVSFNALTNRHLYPGRRVGPDAPLQRQPEQHHLRLKRQCYGPVSWSFTTRDGVWGTAALIETDNTGYAWDPQIAMDAGGNALAVWFLDGTRDSIQANRFE